MLGFELERQNICFLIKRFQKCNSAGGKKRKLLNSQGI